MLKAKVPVKSSKLSNDGFVKYLDERPLRYNRYCKQLVWIIVYYLKAYQLLMDYSMPKFDAFVNFFIVIVLIFSMFLKNYYIISMNYFKE